MTVRVRFDEYDVSKAWVINPFTLRDEPLVPRLKKYMTGLSLHAHGCIVRNVEKPKVGGIHQRDLLATQRKLGDEVNTLVDRAKRLKKGQVSSAVAKYMGIGQKAPSGNDLAGLRAAESRFEDVPEPDARSKLTDDPYFKVEDTSVDTQPRRAPRTPRRVASSE
jgi:hypothetical protein